MIVVLQPQPQPHQSNPKCMNWISKSRTSRVALYFKMISGFCISRDWTHFLPLKLMLTEFCLWKIWHFVYISTRPAGPARLQWRRKKLWLESLECYFLSDILFLQLFCCRTKRFHFVCYFPDSQFSARFLRGWWNSMMKRTVHAIDQQTETSFLLTRADHKSNHNIQW